MVGVPEINSTTCMTIGETGKVEIVLGCHCGSATETFNLVELLFEFCSHCGCSFDTMTTIGHSAYAVCKVRQNNEKMLTKMQAVEHGKDKFYEGPHDVQTTPMKYSSKLMNSIWGMYNRYSVHNFKKNIDVTAGAVAANQQEQSVGSAATSAGGERSYGDSKTAKSPQLLPSFWAPYDHSY